MSHKITRREFGRRTLAAAAAPMIVPSSVLGLAGAVAPSNRVVIGCIGVGNRAHYLMTSALQVKGAQVVAVCDVKTNCRNKAQDTVNTFYENKDCVAYIEHEKVVERDDIDACIVGSCGGCFCRVESHLP